MFTPWRLKKWQRTLKNSIIDTHWTYKFWGFQDYDWKLGIDWCKIRVSIQGVKSLFRDRVVFLSLGTRDTDKWRIDKGLFANFMYNTLNRQKYPGLFVIFTRLKTLLVLHCNFQSCGVKSSLLKSCGRQDTVGF